MASSLRKIYHSPTTTKASKSSSFASRRSVVHSTKGIVASTQPLANQAGIDVLWRGGNAADAAVAVAAALNVTEPGMSGIGGDMFCLFYDAESGSVHALNGSGRSGSKVTLDLVRRELGMSEGEVISMPMGCIHAVTVPGAAAGWVDCVERFGSGKVSMGEILAPAIELAEGGFAVSEYSAAYWKAGENMLKKVSPNGAELLKADRTAPDKYRAPRAGETMRLPTLAKTFRSLAEQGKKGFYEGYVADAIIKVVSDQGGVLCHDDLKHHCEVGSELGKPISLRFRGQGVTETYEDGLDIWEHPPNGQGLVALIALGIFQELEKRGKIPRYNETQHNSAEYLHVVIEVLRIAFADGNWWIADPSSITNDNNKTASLLSPSYLSERAKLFNPKHAIPPSQLSHGIPNSTLPSSSSSFPSPAHQSSDTVYFSITDPSGNAISFINSNFGGFSTPEDPAGNGFGSCIVPKDCGFVLQNRGAKFALHPPDHPNLLAPRKRPYHTIIPGMVTEPAGSSLSVPKSAGDSTNRTKRAKRDISTNDGTSTVVGNDRTFSLPSTSSPTSSPTGPLHSTFGIMGGYMQPQGQVQLLLNQLIFRHNPQTALDAPRICVGAPMPDSSGRGSIDISDAKKAARTEDCSAAMASGSASGLGLESKLDLKPEPEPESESEPELGPVIFIEHSISEQAIARLRDMGHRNVQVVGKDGEDWLGRSVFGRGQIVRCGVEEDENDDDDDDNDHNDNDNNDDDDDNDDDTLATGKRKRKTTPESSSALPKRKNRKTNTPRKKRKTLVYSAGSDPRGDGAAVPLG